MKRNKVYLYIKNHKSYIFLGILSLLIGFLFHLGLSAFVFVSQDATHGMQTSAETITDKTSFSLESRRSAQRIVQTCEAKGEQCLAKEFGRLTEQTSFDHAIQTLRAAHTMSESTRGCHFISHAIAIAETKKDPSKWQEILGTVPPDECTGGFLHGTIEAYTAYDSKFKISSQTIPEVCAIVDKETGYKRKYHDCSHIMGHLLMVETGGHIEPAIRVCSDLPENLQYECYSGVFMENETRENLVSHKIKNKLPWNEKTTKEQENICLQYSGIVGKACWRVIAHMFVYIAKDDPVRVYKDCSRAPDGAARDACYVHGLSTIGISLHGSTKGFPLFCAPYSDSDKIFLDCMEMVINRMMLSSPEYSGRTVNFCKSMPGKYQDECFEIMGIYLQRMVESPSERTEYCSAVPEQYRRFCLVVNETEQ